MGGEGSMSGAITSLKNNRGSLRSKRGGMKNHHLTSSVSNSQLEFVEVSPEKLEEIKKEIRRKSIRGKRIRGSILLVSCSLLIILYFVI